MAHHHPRVGRDDLVTESSPEFPEWSARRSLPLSAMASWSEAGWAEWWADGVRIWHSDFRPADRREAFAPILLDVERDLPEERLPDELGRFYDEPTTRNAAEAIATQRALERGILRLLNDRHFMESAEVPMLALRIFSVLPCRSSEQIVHSILAALGKQWLDPEADDELVPALTYAILEFVDITLLEDVRLHFESVLAQQTGHDAPLIYGIAVSREDVRSALATFERLWRADTAFSTPDIWEAIADELNRHFGKERVAAELRRIVSNRPGLSAEGVDALVPAMRLEHCYPTGDRRMGLRGHLQRAEGRLPLTLSRKRGLSTEIEPAGLEAAMACG
ncbi:MAG TPA: hypothetical protein VGC56_07205 [Allosphingosinicella sp.]|jgi:hypothetical protein